MVRRTLALAALLLAAAVPAATAGPLGPDVSLTVTPSDTRTATTVRARVVAADEAGQITCVSILWGDGAGQGVCMSGHGTGGSRGSYDFTHAYRRPGAWVVRAEVTSEGPDAEQRLGAAAALVRVAPGADVSNGPALPDATPAQYLPPGGDRRTTYLDAVARDEDGWITETLVDWGDGARSRQVRGTQDCADPLLTWPGGSGPAFRPKHRYARPGDRTVRVTTVSTGCDGQHRQVRTRSFRVQVPARF